MNRGYETFLNDNPAQKNKFDEFLKYLCGQLNQYDVKIREKKLITPENIREDIDLIEFMFWQKRQNFWALDQTVNSWPNIVQPMACLIHEVLPRLRIVYPTIRIQISNAYRTVEENAKVDSGSDSLHREFGAIDFKLTDMSGDKLMLAKYIMDRIFVFGSATMLSVGFGIYGGFIHIDARMNRKVSGGKPGPKLSWFSPPYVARNRSGVLTLADQRADLKVSKLPYGAEAMGFPRPLASEEEQAYARLVAENQVIATRVNRQSSVTRFFQSAFGIEQETDVSALTAKIVHDRPEGQTLQISGVNLADYLTPEEVRKGIIPEFFVLDDWHLNQLIGDDFKRSGVSEEVSKQAKATLDRIAASAQAYANDDKIKNSLLALRADLSDDPRRRYVQSLVDAEFWRRRFRARSMPQISTHFNPYLVSGFPSLIMLPDRPIIAHVQSVSHTINVSAASARTTASLGAPRYWDEGEPWHFLGGWGESDHSSDGDAFRRYWRRFPYWHNHLAMPTNSFEDATRARERQTPLDRFYLHLIGCPAIPYMSNHAQVFRRPDGGYNYEKMRQVIVERDTKDVDVNPATLSLREHNRMIAELDDKGRFAPHTLAYRFWGAKRPEEPPERDEAKNVDGAEFAERYGVKEQELFVEFLGNRAVRYKGYLVVTGPTFGGGGSGDKAISRSQQSVVDFCEDIRQVRSLGGGVK